MKMRVTSYLTNFRIKLGLAIAISGIIVNSIIGAFNSSYGSIAVWVLKRYFKTFKKGKQNILILVNGDRKENYLR